MGMLIDADAFERRTMKFARDAGRAGDFLEKQIFEDIASEIQDASTVDPVKHSGGSLIRGGLRQCKNCHFDRPSADLAWSYCPNCGAKMVL